jgi:tetratricopeptide (TPR) repeat protein
LIPILLALAAAAPAAPAGPADSPDNRYRACVALVRTQPDRAAGQAEAWLRSGGGIRAGQCLGLAHSVLEHWGDAAVAFEAAAREAQARQDRRRGDLWVQAGNSRLAAGEAAAALKAFDAALATGLLTPKLAGEVHGDRARAAVALGDLAGARAALDKAIELVPDDGFVWYLSAALARRQSDLKRAQDHIAKAVSLAPNEAAILLEAGNIAGVSGETEAAQGLYARAMRSAPASDAGRAARTALEAARPR